MLTQKVNNAISKKILRKDFINDGERKWESGVAHIYIHIYIIFFLVEAAVEVRNSDESVRGLERL